MDAKADDKSTGKCPVMHTTVAGLIVIGGRTS